MPGLEDLDLRHDAFGEQRRRREVRQPLEGAHDLARLRELGPTFRACLDVRLERGDAESGFAIQELVDFVCK